MVGGLRAGPGRSHATRSVQTGSAPACPAPRLLQTTPHIAWEVGFFSESAAGGKTGGRLSGKERDSFRLAMNPPPHSSRAGTTARTARDGQGKGRRPFADLCLTTWLRRRET